MAKHRELAKELYASKIWRTVVFAGAMLGAPIASADSPPPPQQKTAAAKPKPPPSPIEEKTARITALSSERTALYEQLADADAKELDKVRRQIVVKDAEIRKLVDQIIALRKPRPRTPVINKKPIGRGFVLA